MKRTWPTPTSTAELRAGPDGAIDVHLQIHGMPVALHGVSPDFAITIGAAPTRPLLRIAPELVLEVAAALRSVVEALEAL